MEPEHNGNPARLCSLIILMLLGGRVASFALSFEELRADDSGDERGPQRRARAGRGGAKRRCPRVSRQSHALRHRKSRIRSKRVTMAVARCSSSGPGSSRHQGIAIPLRSRRSFVGNAKLTERRAGRACARPRGHRRGQGGRPCATPRAVPCGLARPGAGRCSRARARACPGGSSRKRGRFSRADRYRCRT